MTHKIYPASTGFLFRKDKKRFGVGKETSRENVYYINDIYKENVESCLGIGETEIKYYSEIFKDRKPTNIELFDLAQSNSEHSRHWFFNGNFIITDPKN